MSKIINAPAPDRVISIPIRANQSNIDTSLLSTSVYNKHSTTDMFWSIFALYNKHFLSVSEHYWPKAKQFDFG